MGWLGTFLLFLVAGGCIPLGAFLILHELFRLGEEGTADGDAILVGGLIIGIGTWALTIAI